MSTTCSDGCMRGGRSTTPLIQAALNGHADAVRVMMSRGAEVNKHEPCDTVVDPLVLGGVDLHLAKNEGSTPLIMTVQDGHLEVLDLLVTVGVEFNHLDVSCLLLPREVIKLLVKKGANVNQVSCKGVTPLHQEALYVHVDYLIRKGSKFEARGTAAKVCKRYVRRRTGRRGVRTATRSNARD
jgi:ankyrin repeat protein